MGVRGRGEKKQLAGRWGSEEGSKAGGGREEIESWSEREVR
jgi:hypothetical protein